MRIKMETQVKYNEMPSIVVNLRNGDARIPYNSARRITTGAKRRVHVQKPQVNYPNLKQSIEFIKVKDGHWKVVAAKTYAAYEEFGTRYRPGHPFFVPAFRADRKNFRADVRKLLQGRLDKRAGGAIT